MAFDPEKDIPDLSGKVVLVTGGKYTIRFPVYIYLGTIHNLLN
jgi:hypothetical protein